MRTAEVLSELNRSVRRGADVDNGILWLCLVDRINPLSREGVEKMMSRYDRGSPQTLYDLAQNAGLDLSSMSKDWLLRDFYPDYRKADDPTAQAISDIYDECRLFLKRDLKSTRDADAPLGIRVTERFFIREMTRALELTETVRKLHEHVIHPQIVRMERAGIGPRIFAATYPGLHPSVTLVA